MPNYEDVRRRLEKQCCDETLTHLDQSFSALNNGHPESASGQIRGAVEALFNAVSIAKLKSTARGGDARKALQNRGILSATLGKFIQSFMEYAGSGGGHAGSTPPKEAELKVRTGLDIIDIGLDLLEDSIRLEVVLAHLNPQPTDSQIQTTCPACGDFQFLNECKIKREKSESVYFCENGCQRFVSAGAKIPIVPVEKSPPLAW